LTIYLISGKNEITMFHPDGNIVQMEKEVNEHICYTCGCQWYDEPSEWYVVCPLCLEPRRIVSNIITMINPPVTPILDGAPKRIKSPLIPSFEMDVK